MATPMEAAAPAVRHEPLFILWKKVKPTDFDGIGDPLIPHGWFNSTETIMEGMELSNNEKVKCASYCLTIDAMIWRETV